MCRIPHLGHLCAQEPAALIPRPSRTRWGQPTFLGDQPPLKNHLEPAQGQYQCPHSPHGDGCQGPAVLNPAVKGGSATLRGPNPGKGAHLPTSQSRDPHCQPCTSEGCTRPRGVTGQEEGRAREQRALLPHEPPTHPGHGGTAPNISQVDKSVPAPHVSRHPPHRAARLWQRAGEGDFHPPWAGERGH